MKIKTIIKKNMLSKTIVAIMIMAMSISSLSGCGSSTDVAAEVVSEAKESGVEISEETVQEIIDAVDEAIEDTQEADEMAGDDALQEEIEENVVKKERPWKNGIPNAQDIVDTMTIGISVGNSLDAFSGNNGVLHNDGLSTETVWGNPKVTQAYMDKIKEAGMDVIRIPVTWYNHVDPDTYEIDAAWLDRVHEVVDYACDEDTVVILNMHHDTGTDGWLKASDNNLSTKKEIYKALWTQIAESFSEYDYNLVFEGFNEMLNDENEWSNPKPRDVEIVNEYNQIFVDTVRATGGNNPERVLIVNTYCAGNSAKMVINFEIPTDTVEDRIIAEVHAYTPYYFTAPEAPDVKTWSHGDVDSVLRYVHDMLSSKGVPVIVGEFGAVPKNNEDEILAYVEYYLNHANAYGIKCCWWDNGIPREFAIFDRNTGDPVKPELVEMLVNTARGN